MKAEEKVLLTYKVFCMYEVIMLQCHTMSFKSAFLCREQETWYGTWFFCLLAFFSSSVDRDCLAQCSANILISS